MEASQCFLNAPLVVDSTSPSEEAMNEDWVTLCIGVLLMVFGIFMTDVRGAMPGASPGYPPPLRFRLILIFGGVLMIALGAYRLLHK